MLGYWLSWFVLTVIKAALLAGCLAGAIGGILHFSDYAFLAVFFVPISIFWLYDFAYQLLVPLTGGVGSRLHKPSDTPMFMGLAPSWREAKELLKKGYSIIWS